MDVNMNRANRSIKMELVMKAIGNWTKERVKACLYGQMESHMLVNGLIINKTEQELLHGKMVDNLQESL